MPQPKDFIEYIRYYDTGLALWQYYYHNGTTVATTTTKTPLNRSPEGWQEYMTSLERGFVYFGLDTIHTTPLKFLKDGAYILRYLYYTYGITAKAELFIEQLDRSDYTYSTYFRGDINFSKLQDEFDYCIVPILEGGHIEKIKSRDNTYYEYDLMYNSLVEWVKHDGIILKSKLLFSVPTGTSIDGLSFSSATFDFPEFVYINTEGSNLFTPFWNVDTANPWTDLFGNDSSNAINYYLSGVGSFIIAPNGSYTGADFVKIYAVINDSAGTFSSEVLLWTSPSALPTGSPTAYNFSFADKVVYVPSTYRVTIAHRVDGSAVNVWATTSSYMNLEVEFSNRYDATYLPILPIQSVLLLILRSITEDNTVTLTSNLLNSTYNAEHYLSSGDGVRGLENSKIRITLNELFEFIDTKFGACLVFDKDANTFYLESKDYVFDNTVNPNYTTPFEITKFQCVPFTSELATNIQIGSQTFNENTLTDEDGINNAKFEANVTNEYLTPMVQLDGKTVQKTPAIRDDIYGIENIRINLTDKKLADSENDNEVFAFHIDTSVVASYTFPASGLVIDYYLLYRKQINLSIGVNYWNIENVQYPESVYNVIYSPARCMYANGSYLRSLYKMNDADFMTFQVAGKNSTLGVGMITTEGATPLVIDEHANIEISSLCVNDNVLFLPYMFHITTKNKINLYALLSEYRYRTIPFIHKGVTLYGFIIKASSKPQIGASTDLVLLSSPDNDLTDLILSNGI